MSEKDDSQSPTPPARPARREGHAQASDGTDRLDCIRDILPGDVGHEIFGNVCNQLGRDNFPDACVDAPGVDRAKLHEHIGNAALKFFDKHLNVRRERSN